MSASLTALLIKYLDEMADKDDIRVEVTLKNALPLFEHKGPDVCEIYSQPRVRQEAMSKHLQPGWSLDLTLRIQPLVNIGISANRKYRAEFANSSETHSRIASLARPRAHLSRLFGRSGEQSET